MFINAKLITNLVKQGEHKFGTRVGKAKGVPVWRQVGYADVRAQLRWLYLTLPSFTLKHQFSSDVLRSKFAVQPTITTMSDAAPAKQVKKATKPKKPKAPAAHPPVAQMVTAAITSLKERNGSSLPAIKKYIAANYKCDVDKLAPFIRKFLKKGVADGKLKQVKASYKVDKTKVEKPKKKPAAKKAAKPKRAKTPKKTAKPKKVKTPKKTAKPKKAKSPKKVAKPKKAKTPVKKAAAKPKKAKTPKKKAAAKKPAKK